jgi:hypothetical protein
MIKRSLASLAGFAFLQAALSGCLVLSLQPAYDDGSVVFDEALVGTWVNTEDETVAAIERGEWRSYKVKYTDRFSTRAFHGNVARLDTETWLDLTEVRGQDDGPLLLPVHGIFRIRVANDTLTVSPLDYNWFARATERKTLGRLLTTLDARRNVVIVSPTAALRRWLASAPPESITSATTYKRKAGP